MSSVSIYASALSEKTDYGSEPYKRAKQKLCHGQVLPDFQPVGQVETAMTVSRCQDLLQKPLPFLEAENPCITRQAQAGPSAGSRTKGPEQAPASDCRDCDLIHSFQALLLKISSPGRVEYSRA